MPSPPIEHREKSLRQFTTPGAGIVWIGTCTCGWETRVWSSEFEAEGQLYEVHIASTKCPGCDALVVDGRCPERQCEYFGDEVRP